MIIVKERDLGYGEMNYEIIAEIVKIDFSTETMMWAIYIDYYFSMECKKSLDLVREAKLLKNDEVAFSKLDPIEQAEITYNASIEIKKAHDEIFTATFQALNTGSITREGLIKSAEEYLLLLHEFSGAQIC